jgi:ABC-type uncharacterized transport system substrate-binding protein
VKRREFIALLGGAAASWPLAAYGQQSALPVIGYLDGGTPETTSHLLTAFRKGLLERSYIEGRDVKIEFRWARGDYHLMPNLAADLVRMRVAAIVAMGSSLAVLAAQAATSTIPILFGFGGDPVETGLVASLNRPGGNITGAVTMNSELGGKRLELLHELVPGTSPFAILLNSNSNRRSADVMVNDAQAAAAAIGRPLEVFWAANDRDLNSAFVSLVQKRAGALVITPDPLFANRRVQVLTLAARHAVPTIYPSREFVEAGGLMSYGSSYTDLHRQAAIILAASSMARNQWNYRSYDRLSSNYSSTSRRPRLSKLSCRRRCSPAPTR